MFRIMFGLAIVAAALSLATVKSVVTSSSSSAADLHQQTVSPLEMMIKGPQHLPSVQADLS